MKNDIFRKIILVLIVFSLAVGPIRVQRAKASALMTGINFTNGVFEDLGNFMTTYLRKRMLDMMVDQMVNWINNDFQGQPQFVEDFEGFLTDSVDNAGGLWLENKMGPEFVRNVCYPDWAFKLRVSLYPPPTFTKNAICTIGQIVGNNEKAIDDFMGDFRNGGWSRMIELTENQNNIFGLYLMAYGEKLDTEQKAKEAAAKDSENGYLGQKVCVEAIRGEETINSPVSGFKKTEIPEGFKCAKWKTITPGSIVMDAARESFFKDVSWLKNNSEWYGYAVAVSDAMINYGMRNGVRALKDGAVVDKGKAGGMNKFGETIKTLVGVGVTLVSPALSLIYWLSRLAGARPPISVGFDQPSTDMEDYLPPEYLPSYGKSTPQTEITYEDPWHISFKAGSGTGADNTDLRFYYAVNSDVYSIYKNPVLINGTGRFLVKWYGVNSWGKQETVKRAWVHPPFMPTDTSSIYVNTPYTIAVAENDSDIALITNKAGATIYYTLDEGDIDQSMVQISSLQIYTAPIHTQGLPIKLQYFAQYRDSHNILWQEPLRTLETIPPFPNGDLKLRQIGQAEGPTGPTYSAPTVGVESSGQTQAGFYFTIKPSATTAGANGAKIVKYEWDLDGTGGSDADYDWRVEDANNNGVFESIEKSGSCLRVSPIQPGGCNSSQVRGQDFGGMLIGAGEEPAQIRVMYSTAGTKSVALRVTDEHGLAVVAVESVAVQ